MAITYISKVRDLKRKLDAMQLIFGNIKVKDVIRKINS
ncbi:hypothetical protein EZN00_01216 [Clostridium tyrobutyricum]|nr:hypothetical protein EZN00_01216 [Clostridium tyrobutyricum]